VVPETLVLSFTNGNFSVPSNAPDAGITLIFDILLFLFDIYQVSTLIIVA